MTVEELIENEWYVVRHSGETPEIALHSALYYLTRAKDGPQLTLLPEQLKELQGAATARFYEIIVRDLKHENVGKSIYRGVERSIVNYQRYLNYCDRQQLSHELKEQVAKQYYLFLQQEILQLEDGCSTNINCSQNDLSGFASELAVDCACELLKLETLLSEMSSLVEVEE